jgi:hypothetical protein
MLFTHGNLFLTAMASNDPTRTITLFFWILDVSDRPVPVDIEDSKTVGYLKDSIVKKKLAAVANVDPDRLILWKVCAISLCLTKLMMILLCKGSITIDKTLKNNVANLRLLDEDALEPSTVTNETTHDGFVYIRSSTSVCRRLFGMGDSGGRRGMDNGTANNPRMGCLHSLMAVLPVLRRVRVGGCQERRGKGRGGW